MELKSYNVQALRGHDYDDHTFQADMRDAGIFIPDEVLYTPRLGPYVIEEIHKQAVSGLPNVINDSTGKNFTPEEAKEVAMKNKSQATSMYNKLLEQK